MDWRSERGLSAVLVLILMPVFLGLLGFAIDGALLVHRQLELETATAAAALAATDAYDRAIWQASHTVVINQSDAATLAAQYLQMNMPSAVVDQVTVNPAQPNLVMVRAHSRVPLAFMPLFGFTTQTLYAQSTAGKS